MNGWVNRNDMRCTAYHEAGHAVAAVLQDRPFQKVFVVHRADEAKEYTQGPLGSVVRHLDKPTFAGKLDEAKKEIVICYAGPYAETFAYPGLKPLLEQDAQDVKEAIGLAKFALVNFTIRPTGASFDNAEVSSKWPQIVAVLDECNKEALSLVLHNQRSIMRLADALLLRRELTRDEVIAITKP